MINRKCHLSVREAVSRAPALWLELSNCGALAAGLDSPLDRGGVGVGTAKNHGHAFPVSRNIRS